MEIDAMHDEEQEEREVKRDVWMNGGEKDVRNGTE